VNRLRKQFSFGPTSIVVAFALVLVMGSALTGCSGDTSTTVTAKLPASASGTIAEYVASDANLATLAAIISDTDLAKTLAGPGPYTLFAPTNEAFAALPAGELAALRRSSPTTKALDLHVAKSKLPAADLIPLNGKTVGTIGGPVKVVIDGRTLKIGGAPVTRTDIITSNGVIHLIGAVITPATA
jgi:uncharacterized surface protein with fasciclin (FAS1) repeats